MSKLMDKKTGDNSARDAHVQKSPQTGMLTLRADLSNKKTQACIKKLFGIAVPDTGRINVKEEYAVAWMSPDELLLLMPMESVQSVNLQLSKALNGSHHLLVQVSDARSIFTISGEDATEVLAKLTPADVSHRAFGPGTIRRSRLAQVPVAFWQNENQEITLVCFRSVSEYVLGLLKNAAQTNSRVGFV